MKLNQTKRLLALFHQEIISSFSPYNCWDLLQSRNSPKERTLITSNLAYA